MKFGRYLKDTQIPEWKKKYIDYRGLKKLISAIKAAAGAQSSPFSLKRRRRAGSPESLYREPPSSQLARTPSFQHHPPGRAAGSTPQHALYGSSGQTLPLSKNLPSVETLEPLDGFLLPLPARSYTDGNVAMESRDRHGVTNAPSSAPSKPSARLSFRRSRTTFGTRRSLFDTYSQFLESITETERKFFDYLDLQIDKVEDFYGERYKEAVSRLAALKEQFRELADHHRAYHNARAAKIPAWKNLPVISAHTLESAYNRVSKRHRQGKAAEGAGLRVVVEAFHRDPESYQTAKKELKRATLEFHRFLELLKDYQALNVTAIYKSVKKFEKTTGSNVHDIYNRNRVDILGISNDKGIKTMLQEVETLYAAHFANGDSRKARIHMRNIAVPSNHHFSVFRSGVLIGLSIPALIVGAYHAAEPKNPRQTTIQTAMLQVYATLGIPVTFSLLVGINLIAWVRARINYMFIFGLNLRTVMDYREYFELPSILFMTLSYAFMLSFSGFLEPHIDATTWPLVWIVFFCATVMDPLQLWHRPSRFWLLRNWIQLAFPGFTSVEFADFWMGDQLCSMTYSLNHLYYVGCVYSSGWRDPTATCNLQKNWISGILLTSIPFFIRFIQCLKRYADSKNYIHLINGGKYCTGIIAASVFFNWRTHGMNHDTHFIVWILLNATYAVYASGWDLLMDWSLLQRKSPYPFLRPELLYDHWQVYYVAIVLNVLIRFVWVIYIPNGSVSYTTRNFVAASFEMLRRIQWNFYRVESEHIGHADQYRVTRDIPLPYSFDDGPPHNDPDDEIIDHARSHAEGDVPAHTPGLAEYLPHHEVTSN